MFMEQTFQVHFVSAEEKCDPLPSEMFIKSARNHFRLSSISRTRLDYGRYKQLGYRSNA